MRLQIDMRPEHVARNLSLLRWSRNILFVISILALGYYGYVLADARIFEARAARQFERAAKQFRFDNPSFITPNPQLPAAVSEAEVTLSLIHI